MGTEELQLFSMFTIPVGRRGEEPVNNDFDECQEIAWSFDTEDKKKRISLFSK